MEGHEVYTHLNQKLWFLLLLLLLLLWPIAEKLLPES
jgi:hypothetical protein